jgi:hypothetical protein
MIEHIVLAISLLLNLLLIGPAALALYEVYLMRDW